MRIGYYKRKITFIPGALPGEVVEVEVTNVTEKFIEATIHKFKQKSKQRVTPVDNQDVGGFELEHLSYSGQLAFKQDVIRQALESINQLVMHTISCCQRLGWMIPRLS